jgi:hypothetical protein
MTIVGGRGGSHAAWLRITIGDRRPERKRNRTMPHRLLPTIAAGVLLAGLYGCGTPDAKPDAASRDTANAEAAPADDAPSAAPAETGPQPLTVADIDRWANGMAAELEGVHAAAARLKQAKTADDTMTAMTATQDMSTLDAGAQAAGVDRERYNLIRTTLSEAASYLAPSVGGVDTTGLSPDQRAEIRPGNATQLEQMKDVVPADVMSALTPRAAELRTRDLELVAARMKAAGM